ncbi:50S ribosomal protein L21 [Candidatus Phytoplasma sacchari]|uniref:Large ribosomal subunit protein bL21 n=1 Tax=Candidatus Phytoplasma sacchari TaxID=2609813 RepID=A0ABY7M0X8_9MOLU|nr:50S ribosomal protein L21 [Candidatus Phytoplasma sacchari]
MFAIIKSGSKQYKVSPGQEIFIEKLPLKEEEIYLFDQVLAMEDDNKKNILGNPFLKNVKIEAKVIKQGKAKKIIIFKYKKRKKYRLKKGHRQLYTKLLITKIIF